MPQALWVPTDREMKVYRGTPAEMVLEMSGAGNVRDALKALCDDLAEHRKIRMHLPWDESDERCSELFVMGLLALGLGQRVPSA